MASLRTPKPFDPDTVNGPLVESTAPVECQDDILDLEGEGLDWPCKIQLKALLHWSIVSSGVTDFLGALLVVALIF